MKQAERAAAYVVTGGAVGVSIVGPGASYALCGICLDTYDGSCEEHLTVKHLGRKMTKDEIKTVLALGKLGCNQYDIAEQALGLKPGRRWLDVRLELP